MAAAIFRLATLFTVFLAVVPTISEAAAQPVQINADLVTATDHGQTLDARGHVFITDDRITIRADRVLYVRKSGHIQLIGHVRVTTPQGELQAGEAAVQLTRANALDSIDASGGVTTRSANRTLKADRIAYQTRDDTLIANGHVVLIAPDLTITGGTLIAKGTQSVTVTGRPRIENREGFIEGDRLEVAVEAQIAFVRGNVASVFQDTRITSAAATLLAKENKAIFREKVTVIQPGRTMSAELVTYYYKERRIVSEGKTTIKVQQPP